MQKPIAINPFKCTIWSLHERLEGEITEESCKAEIASVLEHGQMIPVLGRRLHGNPDYQVEIIYGARRLFIARHLNRDLIVDLRELSDRDAIIAMDMENRLRKDISPYERGLSYTQWLRSGHFKSQDEIARALNVSTSQVSRLLRVSRLPAVIVSAFRSPTDICENWGLELMDALDDPDRRDSTIRAARALGRHSPRLLGREVFRQMCSYPETDKSRPKAGTHDKVIIGGDGSPLFRGPGEWIFQCEVDPHNAR
jgi:ParB family chromosome partitioning protein